MTPVTEAELNEAIEQVKRTIPGTTLFEQTTIYRLIDELRSSRARESKMREAWIQ